MVLETKSLEEKVLIDQKPFRDALGGTFEIVRPRGMKVSPDSRKILFIIEKWVTASLLVQVDINTGKFDELFSAESFEFVYSGKFKGNLLVSVSEIKDRGRDIYYHIYDWKGKDLHLFANEMEFMEFRSNAITRKVS